MGYYLEQFLLPILAGSALIFIYTIIKAARVKNKTNTKSVPLMLMENKNVSDFIAFDIRRDSDKSYNDKFIDEYFKILNKYITQARHSILVADYLAHHRSLKINTTDNEYLSKKYRCYYEEIEKYTKENRLHNIRLLQLPLEQIYHTERSSIIKKAVDIMFWETLWHIKRCLVEESPNYEFYIIGVPFRPYSFMLIDQDYLIFEFDRYNKRCESIPDQLLVKSVRPIITQENRYVLSMLEQYKQHFNTVIKNYQPITLDDLKKALKELQNDIKEKLSTKSDIDKETITNLQKSLKIVTKKSKIFSKVV